MRPSRTIAAMDPRHTQRRELIILLISVVGLSRLLDGPLLWLAAALAGAAAAAGAARLLGDPNPRATRPEAILLPALATAASVGALQVIPLGVLLVPALAAAVGLIDRVLRFELRLSSRDHEATPEDRVSALAAALAIAFLAFVGAAAILPGGLVEPGSGFSIGRPAPIPEALLLVLALVDATVAGLLGFRVAMLRERSFRAALFAAATYASVVAIAAAGVRAIALPRLLAPALLALVFFVWDGVHGAPPAQRRDPRWIWQTVVLIALGIAVVAWNLALPR